MLYKLGDGDLNFLVYRQHFCLHKQPTQKEYCLDLAPVREAVACTVG